MVNRFSGMSSLVGPGSLCTPMNSKKTYRVAAGLALHGSLAYDSQRPDSAPFWSCLDRPHGNGRFAPGRGWVEISLMFSIAGLFATKTLRRSRKILGINNRLFFAIVFAAIFSFIEIWSGRLPLPGLSPGVPSRYLSPCTSPSLRQPRTAIIGSRKPRLRLSGLCLPSTPWP